ARSIQNFITNSRWDLDYLKRLYVKLVIDEIGVPGGAFIFDDAEEKKSGYWSPGTGAQFDGPDGQTARALAAQVLQYFGGEGLGWALVDIRLYLPKYWFPAGPAELADPDESAKYAKFADKRKARRIPEEIVFRAKNQICSDMLIKAYNEGVFPAKWVLFGAFLGHEKAFIDSIPKELFYFGGVHCDDKFYTETPTFSIPEKKEGGGRNPKNMAPSFSPLKAEEIVANDPTPWRSVEFGLGSNGPLLWDEKLIRVIEIREDDKPGGRIWLYAKKFKNGAVKYQISNAPEDTPLEEIRKVSTLRRAIEQNFKECKSGLGMDQFEGRTWDGWHRHMTMTMLTHFFLLLMRKVFSVNIEDLSEKGRKTYEYLPSIGQDRVAKDGPLSQAFRAMIEDKNQCQDQD
ncbi:MAG: transposase, partial [Deltaproteobacteria bacterium]|nr:transposase [Deltaproteobacteria bacterium]